MVSARCRVGGVVLNVDHRNLEGVGLLLTGALAVTCVGLSLQADAADILIQRHNSNACQAYDGSDQAMFTQSNDGIYRKTATGGGTKSVMCPFFVDTHKWISGSELVVPFRARLSSGSGGWVTCHLRQYDDEGGLVSSASASVLVNEPGALNGFVDVEWDPTTYYVNVYCGLPEGVRLQQIELYASTP